MTRSPYATAERSAFWSRSVSRDFDPRDLARAGRPLLRQGDRVMSAGSCFAANTIPYLEKSGYEYLRTEWRPLAFMPCPEKFSYDAFTAAYGNVYTARQMQQLLRRARGTFKPKEKYWEEKDRFVDPFRPGLKYFSRTALEFDLLTKQHLNCVVEGLRKATVFLFTVGLTEAWVSRSDGAVYPACPGTIAGSFDPAKHAFHNLTAEETARDLSTFIREARKLNKKLRFILTVSPVPLVATATEQHVLEATIHSKSALRVAMSQVAAENEDVVYFPAYEIVTGPQAPFAFFETDRRNVSAAGVEAVMSAFLAASESNPSQRRDEDGRVTAWAASRELSKRIGAGECEEAMADREMSL